MSLTRARAPARSSRRRPSSSSAERARRRSASWARAPSSETAACAASARAAAAEEGGTRRRSRRSPGRGRRAPTTVPAEHRQAEDRARAGADHVRVGAEGAVGGGVLQDHALARLLDVVHDGPRQVLPVREGARAPGEVDGAALAALCRVPRLDHGLALAAEHEEAALRPCQGEGALEERARHALDGELGRDREARRAGCREVLGLGGGGAAGRGGVLGEEVAVAPPELGRPSRRRPSGRTPAGRRAGTRGPCGGAPRRGGSGPRARRRSPRPRGARASPSTRRRGRRGSSRPRRRRRVARPRPRRAGSGAGSSRGSLRRRPATDRGSPRPPAGAPRAGRGSRWRGRSRARSRGSRGTPPRGGAPARRRSGRLRARRGGGRARGRRR